MCTSRVNTRPLESNVSATTYGQSVEAAGTFPRDRRRERCPRRLRKWLQESARYRCFRLQLVEVTGRLHALVQNANDFYDSLAVDAVVESMNRVSHLGPFSRHSGMPDMEAADTRAKLGPLSRKRPVRLSRHLLHGGSENGGVAPPPIGAPSLGTDGQDVGEIDLRWAGEAEPRHPA